jgi:hypothetical protein
VKSVNSFCDRLKANGEPDVTSCGNRIYRFYGGGGDRYLIDFADGFTAEGWMQFDTDQDASYFGTWVNPTRLCTLTYCEGDWSLVECDDATGYNTQVESACQFYGVGFIAKTISQDGSVDVYRQDRGVFFAVEGGAA